MRWVLILLLLAAPSAADSWSVSGRGYTERASGMDLDDDYIVNEAADNTACDNATSGDGDVIVCEDIDGDTTDECQIYVHESSGVDDSNCGGPTTSTNAPCATVSYVLANRMDSDTDSATEDYICLYATGLNDELQIGDIDGASGTKTRTKTGNEIYDFQYPSNPNVLMGWDTDQDDEYPPYDDDDSAVFDGDNGSHIDQWLDYNYGGFSNDTDRWEFAHLEVQDYGRNKASETSTIGAIRGNNVTNPRAADHLYFHDIEMRRINYQQETRSGTITLNLFSMEFNYQALENMTFWDIGGYLWRGSGSTTDTYYRAKNLSATWYGEDIPEYGNGASLMKMWGNYRYVEILDNHFDGYAGDWDLDGGRSGNGLRAIPCVKDWWAINNEIVNFSTCFVVQQSNCVNSPGDNINFLRNLCYEAYDDQNFSAVILYLGGGSVDDSIYMKNVTVANNIFWGADSRLQKCLVVAGDNSAAEPDPVGDTVIFANNTCYSDEWASNDNFYAIDLNDDSAGVQHHTHKIFNNIIAGSAVSSDNLFRINGTAAGWHLTGDYNIWEDNAQSPAFYYNGTGYSSLAAFNSASGLDANSKGNSQNACDVTFGAPGTGNLHLDSGDTCALDMSTATGAGMESYFTVDYDDETRDDANWDVGADEYDSGYDPTGACCDSACALTVESGCTDWRGAGSVCTPDPCEDPPVPVGSSAEGLSSDGGVSIE